MKYIIYVNGEKLEHGTKSFVGIIPPVGSEILYKTFRMNSHRIEPDP